MTDEQIKKYKGFGLNDDDIKLLQEIKYKEAIR